ncbi:hypothetical protein NL529_30030, partial [Klebsiella pneumoniae]|nr:hypothetical protein [Klebsiella pneumoniae]
TIFMDSYTSNLENTSIIQELNSIDSQLSWNCFEILLNLNPTFIKRHDKLLEVFRRGIEFYAQEYKEKLSSHISTILRMNILEADELE